MTGEMISCRSNENRDERCIGRKRLEVMVSAMASFLCGKGYKWTR